MREMEILSMGSQPIELFKLAGAVADGLLMHTHSIQQR
jgi:hypothetical protein